MRLRPAVEGAVAEPASLELTLMGVSSLIAFVGIRHRDVHLAAPA